MFSSKSVLIALMACAVPAMAETAYMLPEGLDSSDKVVISMNAETGAVEFQKADGTWLAGEKIDVPASDEGLIQKAFWYDDGAGPAGGCGCNGAVVAPRPYVQGGFYYAQPVMPAIPPTHVRRVRERTIYEYDTGGVPPGPALAPAPAPMPRPPMPAQPPVATPYGGDQLPNGYAPEGVPQGGYPGY